MSEEEINVSEPAVGANTGASGSVTVIDGEGTDADFDEAVASLEGGDVSKTSVESSSVVGKGDLGEDTAGGDDSGVSDAGNAVSDDSVNTSGADGGEKYANSEFLNSLFGGGSNQQAETVSPNTGAVVEKDNSDNAASGSEPGAVANTANNPGGMTVDDIASRIMEESKNDETLKGFAEEFPEDAKAFARFASMAAKQMLESMKGGKKNDGISERLARLEAREAMIAQEESNAKASAWDREVEKGVPEWRDLIRNDKKFPEWFEKQSNLIKNCLTNASQPSDVVDALNKFKTDTGRQAARMTKMRGIYNNPANDRKSARRVVDGEVSHGEDADFDEAADWIEKNF